MMTKPLVTEILDKIQALSLEMIDGRIVMRVHPETYEVIRQEIHRHYSEAGIAGVGVCHETRPGEVSLYGWSWSQDMTVPAGLIRVHGESTGLVVDIPVEIPHEPQGGTCHAEAACSCGWSCHRLPEGTLAVDAYRYMLWRAQRHRSDTGHAVEVVARVAFAGRADDDPS